MSLMHSDRVLRVSPFDEVIGEATKLRAHTRKPDLLLHRAFSVFLFDLSDRLLMTRRAPAKITFPAHWTNTCCSHPLYGQQPDEACDDAVVGVCRAASRRMRQELGLSLQPDAFRLAGRFLYAAHNVTAEGEREEGYGEAELDYVLFASVDANSIVFDTLAVDDTEVDRLEWMEWTTACNMALHRHGPSIPSSLTTLSAHGIDVDESDPRLDVRTARGDSTPAGVVGGHLVSPWFALLSARSPLSVPMHASATLDDRIIVL